MNSKTLVVTLALLAGSWASCSRDPQVLKQQYVAKGDRYIAAKK